MTAHEIRVVEPGDRVKVTIYGSVVENSLGVGPEYVTVQREGATVIVRRSECTYIHSELKVGDAVTTADETGLAAVSMRNGEYGAWFGPWWYPEDQLHFYARPESKK